MTGSKLLNSVAWVMGGTLLVLALSGATQLTSAPPFEVKCPLVGAAGTVETCIITTLGAAQLEQAASGNGTRTVSIPLPRVGTVRVALSPFSVYTHDAVVGEYLDGVLVTSSPEPKTYVGQIEGDSQSEVRLTLVNSGLKGFLATRNETFIVDHAASFGVNELGLAVIYSERDFRGTRPMTFGNDTLDVPELPPTPGDSGDKPTDPNGTRQLAAPSFAESKAGTPTQRPLHSTIPAVRYARVFLASDDQFRALFSDWRGEQQARINALDSIFQGQFEVRLRIAGQFSLSSASDVPGPNICTTGDSQDVIAQFRIKIQGDPVMGPGAIPRDLSILITGRNPDAVGCAYQGRYNTDTTYGLGSSYAYALSAAEDYDWWSRVANLGHEIGHVFGGFHQDDASRPPNTGAHSRYDAFFFCWVGYAWVNYHFSLMLSVLYPGCVDFKFSDGTVSSQWNNRAFMLNEQVSPRLTRIGLNFVTQTSGISFISSGDLWGHTPNLVGDGNMGTYWWANTEVSWLRAQWPSSKYVHRIEVHGWVGYYLSSFTIKLSENGQTWTQVFAGGSTSVVDFNVRFRPMWAKFIRLDVSDVYRCCGALNEFAVIREIEAVETVNVASWRSGSSSGNLWGHLPFEAVDGNFGTYWWGTSSSGSWIRFDFPATCFLYFRLQMFSGYGVLSMEVRVFTSGGGEGWSTRSYGSPQVDIFELAPLSGCTMTGFKITFLDNGPGGLNDYPVVRELEMLYGE